MAQIDKANLKPKFEAGKRPTQSDFYSLIESSVNMIDNKATIAEAQNETVTDKFITCETVKSSVLHFAPVKKVNGVSPNATTGDVSIPSSSESVSGVVMKANVAEASAGTNDTKFISPLLARKVVDTYVKLNGVSPVNGNFSLASFDDSNWITLPAANFNSANSITNFNTSTAIRYRKKNGVVYLDGCFKGGVAQTNGITYELFTLPGGYIPSRRMSFVLSRADTSITYKSGRIDVNTDGKVYGVNCSDLWNSVSGISFLID